MYAGTGMVFPYFQNFSQEFQQLEELFYSQKSIASLNNLVQSSTISEYDLGGEGDLFKAPEPILEEPTLGLDPLSAAISMISCGSEEVISPQGLKVSDIESMQNEQLLNDVLYECEKELLAQSGMDMPISDSDLLDIKIPLAKTEEGKTEAIENSLCDGSLLQKSVSSECLSSMEWISGASLRPTFLDFPPIDFSSVYGMRRAFSEGDIKTLSNGNTSLVQSPVERPPGPSVIASHTIEERRQKLTRYRNKKSKRNFGRKIKYACRKALADSQPRIRGRFAKTEELDVSKKQ